MKTFISWVARKHDEGSIRLSTVLSVLTLMVISALVYSKLLAQDVESWFHSDVGTVAVGGNDSYDPTTDTFTSKGAGLGIDKSADSHHFFYQKIQGDAEIVARVLNIEQVTPGSLAGIAIRSSTASTSTVAAVTITADERTQFAFRTQTGKASQSVSSTLQNHLPLWFRLVRKSSSITGYTSTNGLTWVQISKQTISMSSNVVAGVIVSSGDTNQLAGANIDQLSIKTSHPADLQAPSTPSNFKATIIADTSVTLSWSPSSDDVGVSGYRIYRNGKYIATTGSTTFTDTGLPPNTAQSYQVKAVDESYKLSGSSVTLKLKTKALSVSAPWNHRDFGSIGLAGSVFQTGEQFTVQASGSDLGAVPDNFHFVYQPAAGNFEWIAKVSNIQNGIATSKAGIMVRELLNDRAANVALLLTQDKQFYFNSRLSSKLNRTRRVKSGSTSNSWTWFKLSRLGNMIRGYSSSDGKTWKLIGEETVSMTYNVYVGLAVTSADNSKLCEATFSDLSLRTIEDAEQPTPESQATLTGTELVGSLNLGTLTASTGGWEQYDYGLKSKSRRGSVEYDFTIPKDGLYQLTVKGCSWGSVVDTVYPLDVTIDSQFIDRINLFSIHGGSATVSTYTPWLKAGSHHLKLFWDGVQPRPLLVIQSIIIQKPLGADSDQNGIVDWVDERIKALNSFDKTSIESATSPACIEGKVRFLSMMKLSGTVKPQAGAGARWFANIPLSSTALTKVTGTFENGGLTASTSIKWKETNVLTSAATILVRKGDALLLNAYSTGMPTAAFKVAISDGNELNSTTDKPLPYTFKTAGTFTVTGTYDSSTSKAITVKVIESSFGSSPEAWVGRSRNWDCPKLAAESSVEADPRIKFTFIKNLTGGGKQYNLMVDAAEPRVVVARLGSKGPILATATINGVAIYSAQQTTMRTLGNLPDGSRVVEMTIVATGSLNNLSLVLNIFASGVTFDDGSISKTLTAADFDALGQAKVRFIYPVGGAAHAVCHYLKAYQGSQYVGSR